MINPQFEQSNQFTAFFSLKKKKRASTNRYALFERIKKKKKRKKTVDWLIQSFWSSVKSKITTKTIKEKKKKHCNQIGNNKNSFVEYNIIDKINSREKCYKKWEFIVSSRCLSPMRLHVILCCLFVVHTFCLKKFSSNSQHWMLIKFSWSLLLTLFFFFCSFYFVWYWYWCCCCGFLSDLFARSSK